MTIKAARMLTEELTKLSDTEYTFAMIDNEVIVYQMKDEVITGEMSVDKALCVLNQLRGY